MNELLSVFFLHFHFSSIATFGNSNMLLVFFISLQILQCTRRKLYCIFLTLLILSILSTKVVVKLYDDTSMTIYENGQSLLYEKHQSTNNAKFTHENDQQILDNHQDLPTTTGDNHGPYECSQTMSESSQTVSRSSQAQSRSSQAPSRSSQALSRSSQAWSESNQVPSESNQALSESSKVPSQAPSGSSHAQSGSSQALSQDKSSQTQSESDQLLDQSVHQNHQRALTGFALCLSYWEQQTNSLLNMWSFQKWAKQSGNLSVVEPFARNSILGFPRVSSQLNELAHELRFRDYFDLEYWTNETAKQGIPPMVTWDTFTRHASRKVVVVILVYEVPPGGVYVNDDLKNHTECNLELKRFYNFTKTLLDCFHFEVIKTVCFASYTMKQRKLYPKLEKFNSYLTDDNQTNLTYWFSFWRGVQVDRITINHKAIGRGREENGLAMARPSPKIIEDSKRYVKTVLKIDSNKYTAVAFRTNSRKSAMVRVLRMSRDAILTHFLKCASNISLVLKELNTNHSFLSIDLGRFGDLASGKYFDYDSNKTFDGKGTKVFQTALNAVYGNKTVDEYHNDFIRAANGIEDSGYIGAMQKTIAENAKCLVVMGGRSTFQRSMIQHHQSTSNCVKYLCYPK